MIPWRDSARPLRFVMFDAKVTVCFAPFLVNMALWTFVLAVAAMVFFYGLEYKGLTFDAALRQIRSWFAGSYRPPKPVTQMNYPADFGRMDDF